MNRDTEYLAERDPESPLGLTYAQRLRSDFEDNFARMMVGGAGTPSGLIAGIPSGTRTIEGEWCLCDQPDFGDCPLHLPREAKNA